MYAVDWLQTALDELTALWLAAGSAARQQITLAASQIDARLAEDPYGQSESREGANRILIERPLAVTFRVETDATVVVLHVWYIEPHS
jgi:hypothetical protein